MRTTILLKRPECVVYLVECRFHEHPSWTDTGSAGTELIYPLGGGYALESDGGIGMCLPARLTVCHGRARYRIRHFSRLPDRTLVIGLPGFSVAGCESRLSHLFLAPAEVAGLHLLAATLSASDVQEDSLPLLELIARALRRLRLAAIPHAIVASNEAAALERGLEHMLTHRGATTVAEAARVARVGEWRFRYGFRNLYSTTPNAVRRTLRLAHALDHMFAGGTVTAAARVSGFAHVNHLSGELRRLADRAPTALLQAQRRCGMWEAAALWACA
jgi:AraC-like DNA-binding protein